MKKRWHINSEGGAVTLCRQLPPRFDFAVQTQLPHGLPHRLAHQIRQDLWRALQNVRGFSPVVKLEPLATGWRVTAGGRSMGQVAPATLARAEAVLNDARNRARWLRNAGGATT